MPSLAKLSNVKMVAFCDIVEEKAKAAARALFAEGSSDLTPAIEVGEDAVRDGAVDVGTLLVLGKLVPSRSEGRRAIEQGGVSVDGEKVTDVRATVSVEALKSGVLVKRGKKAFAKFIMK